MDSKGRLLDRLRGINLLRNRSAESALISVRRGAFLPPELEAFSDCDTPVPCICGDTARFVPSLRFMALLLESLELTENQRVAVIDSRGGYVAAAVAAAMGRKGTVTAVEFELKDEEDVLKNLERAGMSNDVQVMSLYAFMAKSSSYTRIILLADELMPRDLVPQVADMGFVVSRGGPEGLALARHVRSGDDVLEILYGDMRLIGPLAGPKGQEPAMDVDVSRVLGLEDIMSHVWTERYSTEKEANIAELVRETFEDGPLDISRTAKSDKRRLSAQKAFHAAYLYQTMGYLEDAEDLYRASHSIHPSAEALTFLGWRLSFDGRYEEAIKECKKAIEIDPTLGNPYNDIGAYLIEMGQLDEAIEWLQKALESERYCCYCYAHCNLGRAYLMKGKKQLAKRELEKALDMNPDYELARDLLNRVSGELDYFS